MQLFLLIPLVYLAAVAETSLADVLRVGQTAPELLALTAVVWLLLARGRWAFLAAGAIALVGDFIAPGRLGVGAAWMLLAGYGLSRLKGRLPTEHLVVQVPMVLAAVTLWALAVAATGRLLGDVPLPWSAIPSRAAGVGLYTAGVSLPVLMVLGWLAEPRRPRPQELAEL